MSARVAALSDDGQGVDYGVFVNQLKDAVEPVLIAYQQRDLIVRKLHENDKQIDGSQLCILYRTVDEKPDPSSSTQEAVLANLLTRSGVQPQTLPNGKVIKGLSSYNLRLLDENADNPDYLDRVI